MHDLHGKWGGMYSNLLLFSYVVDGLMMWSFLWYRAAFYKVFKWK